MNTNLDDLNRYLRKWQEILRLRDWDIVLQPVTVPWRKTGDIKIDEDDRNAVLLVNVADPKQTNAESLIIHELLHLKLWAMDQMIEGLINNVYGEDESDSRRSFAYTQFMHTLEATTEDLAKAFTTLGADDKTPSFGRLRREVEAETGMPMRLPTEETT